MTVAIAEQAHAKRGSSRRGLAVGIVAAVSALSLGLGATAAYAATYDITSGHIDVVHTSYDADSDEIVLDLNNEGSAQAPDGLIDPADAALVVPFHAGGGSGPSGYILPDDETVAALWGVPYAGFAAGEDILASEGGPFALHEDLSYNLTDVDYTAGAGSTGTGTVDIRQGGTVFFTAEGQSHAFDITGEDGEGFHEHATWTFSQPGTYVLTFTVSAPGGYSAGAQEYTFLVG
ncbi:TIGR03769 domain-containing protein [Compostimonas suwonensis]|nr:TIGR03769 domain-containing protein [Compostimonas suwonensis]